jgi:hypothetical protein
MMLLSSVHVHFWYMSARRGAFVVGYGGERDSGVKWESPGENICATKQEYFVGFTHTGMVCRTVKYKSQHQQLLNSHSANCIYN